MKNILLGLLVLPLYGLGQYSNYYNVNNNVKVSGTVDHNVTTIDYGALANANAIMEQNRLANLQYANEKEKQAVMAIAQDPSKAYDYGIDNNWKVTSTQKKEWGWKNPLKFMYHKTPHTSLFIFIKTGGIGCTYENISKDGVTSQIIIYPIMNLNKAKEIDPHIEIDFEEIFKYPDLIEGSKFLSDNSKDSAYLQKKDIDRANIGGINGFCGTLIWEDKYEKCITENYSTICSINGEKYLIGAKVRYKGDTDEVNFEQLEGRRSYFNPLMKKIISTITAH
jgi:hypothetical protein